MLSNIGTTELLIIAGIIFLLFGGKKLTEIARGMGETSKEMKKMKKEYSEAVKEEAGGVKDNK